MSDVRARPARQAARPPCLQRKLAVGRTDDPLEHEADRIADAVTRMPAPEVAATPALPQVSRKCADCEEEGTLRASPAGAAGFEGDAPASVHRALGAPGRPLDAATRAYFEPRFGRDLGAVRVHTGPLAAQSARDVDARAYTVGASIAFDSGAYAPATPEGEQLIAHELAHVMQQTGASAGLLGAGGAASPAEPVVARRPNLQRPTQRPTTAPPPPMRQGPSGGRQFRRPRSRTEEKAPPPTNYKLNPPVQIPGGARRRATLPKAPDPIYVEKAQDVGRGTDVQGPVLRNALRKDVAHLRYMLEREPRMVLERGGEAPDFLSAGDLEIHRVDRAEAFVYENLDVGDQIEWEPRLFHVLDALDHDYALAKTADEEVGIILAYLPELDTRQTSIYLNYPMQPAQIEIGGKYYTPRLPVGAAIAQFPLWKDPATAKQRLAAIRTIMEQRQKLAQERELDRQRREREEARLAVLAEAENVALKGGKRREGKCTSRRNPQKGGNDRHNAYARYVAKVKDYKHPQGRAVTQELTWTTPENVSLSFDTYDPQDRTKVWEVKTRHEWTSPTGVASAPYHVPDFSKRIADLEVQRLTGLYIAARCGLDFRYAVDNCAAYNGLRQQWALPPVEYIPYEGEPRQPC